MRVIAPCIICAKEQKSPDVSKLNFLNGELDETGVVYLECPKGHKSAVVYDARRYQVLLRSGGKALLDGHASESIASMSVALERTYEFYIRVICRHRGIPQEEIDKAWKSIGSQSERQLGAFNFIFLLQEKSTIDLDPKISKIRNRIVHKGQIAKEGEAQEFGEMIYRRIRNIEKTLDLYSKEVREESKHEIEIQKKSIPHETEWGHLTITTVMANDKGEVVGVPETFSDYLTALRQSISKGLA